MTIAELLGRIGLAFERTFNLVMKGAFGALLLSDLGIFLGIIAVIIAVVVVSFAVLIIFIVLADN